MKKLLSIIFLFYGIGICAQEDKIFTKSELYNPFDSISYDSIQVFNMFVDAETGRGLATHETYSILRNGRLIGEANLPGRTLNKAQLDTLMNIVNDTNTYNGSKAACFEPHLAFVLYKEGKPIHSITFCLDCKFYNSDFTIPASQYYYTNWAAAGKNPEISFKNGFSDNGRKRIIAYCNSLGMSFCASY
jgi:hypothetical protein